MDAHHLQHWCDGGETRLDNLVLLCRHHHRLLHQDGYEIVKHGNQQFEFLTPAGGAMPAALVPQFATAAEDMATEILAIEREHEGFGLVIDSRTAVTRWQGERMDYDLAVGVMMRRPMLEFKGRAPYVAHFAPCRGQLQPTGDPLQRQPGDAAFLRQATVVAGRSLQPYRREMCQYA